MDIIKIAFLGILTALIYALLKNLKAASAPLAILGGAAIVFVAVADGLIEIIGEMNGTAELAGLEKENVSILLRTFGICAVAQFASDICADNSCASIASAVELAGKTGAIIIMAPMIKSVARLAVGLINA